MTLDCPHRRFAILDLIEAICNNRLSAKLRGLFEPPGCIAKGPVGGDAVALTVPLHPPTGTKLPVWVRTFSPATDLQASAHVGGLWCHLRAQVRAGTDM